MIGRSANARELHEEHAARDVPDPRRLRAICRTESEVSAGWIVGIAFEMAPLAIDVGKQCASFDQQHVQPALRQLLRDDSSTSASTDDDDVTHGSLSFEITKKFV